MSNSSLVIKKVFANKSNYTLLREGKKIDKIVIHHAAGTNFAAIGKEFKKVGRNGSAHYGINEREIHQYVDEVNTAWHCGNWQGNLTSVGIETCNSTGKINTDKDERSWKVADTTFNTLAILVADIAKRNNLGKVVVGKNLFGHRDFAKTFCPGNYLYGKLNELASKANEINRININQVNVFYKVRTKGYGWLPEVMNLEDYAGYNNSEITDIAIKVDVGSVKYRVHIKNGKWLPYVTGYDTNNFINGYAGEGSVIDGVEVYYYTPSNIRPYKKAKYKVNNYSWQYDNEKDKNQDGYAGLLGVPVTKFQITIE